MPSPSENHLETLQYINRIVTQLEKITKTLYQFETRMKILEKGKINA
jgi:hypothetical protein